MGKITLSEALKKATVENNLQNYLGLNADGAIGKMTPERLASVVGGLTHSIGDSFYTCSIIGKEGDFDSPIKVAEEIMSVLPMKRISFMCIHLRNGIRVVRGLIYEKHDYGIFFIENYNGSSIKVSLNESKLNVVQ